MSANANLHRAKDAKNDEFYTQLTDVSKELMHYKEHFKGKIILCNCDDPTWSAFWKYFYEKVNDLNGSGCILVNGKPKMLYGRVLIRKKVGA